ncbi:MAG: hypothetical protein Q8P69_01335 [bacterium]|nr:hypothetical protein [bacterium]
MPANSGSVGGMPNNWEAIMAKAKSEFLSGYLTMAQIVKTLIDEVKNLNGNDEDIRKIETDPKVRRQIAELLVRRVEAINTLTDQLGWWVTTWAQLGIVVDLTAITLPTLPASFGPARLIVIPKGLTIRRGWEIAESLFPCKNWISGDLDKAIPVNDRTADKAYSVVVRDRTEADEEFKNLSANDLKTRNHKGITALETIVDEIGFYRKTGGHRDIQNVTLCSGSRFSDGCIPSVHWYGSYDGLGVFGFHVDDRHSGLRSREAVL